MNDDRERDGVAGKSADGCERLPRKLADIDWSRWQAVDRATLTFIVDSEQVLLIRKKRGLGAGKINGPGGRLEAGESFRECAIREVEEEVCVTQCDPRESGELRFQFTDGYSIHVHVFLARGCEGRAAETDEALPMWFALDAIPYEEMWADDVLWLPRLLAGERIEGRFLFDGDTMLDYSVG
jgi:8-oxo-dGTP diphosphatase